jgi:hypothetical protein
MNGCCTAVTTMQQQQQQQQVHQLCLRLRLLS